MEKKVSGWAPRPGYLGLSRDEVVKKTEEELKWIGEKYREIKPLVKAYDDRINVMLQEKAEAREFIKVVEEEGYQKIYNWETIFNRFAVACRIACLEEEGELITNLNSGETMEDICEHMQTVIFFLRRIEFGWEEESYSKLMEKIKEWKISFIFLAELIFEPSVLNKMAVVEGVSRLLYKGERKKDMLLFLFYIAKKCQNNEAAVLPCATFLLEAGELYWANEMLKSIENPSDEIVFMQKKLAERI